MPRLMIQLVILGCSAPRPGEAEVAIVPAQPVAERVRGSLIGAWHGGVVKVVSGVHVEVMAGTTGVNVYLFDATWNPVDIPQNGIRAHIWTNEFPNCKGDLVVSGNNGALPCELVTGAEATIHLYMQFDPHLKPGGETFEVEVGKVTTYLPE